MCELFGFNSCKERDLRGYLTEFYSHSVRHPHGWGLATYKNNNINLTAEPVCAIKSGIIDNVIEICPPQSNLIGHIRLATIGGLDINNCHPFISKDISGRQWIMAHNGTIFSGMELLKYREIQKGSTDSERILMYFIDKINEHTRLKGSPLDGNERFEVIDEAIASVTKRNKINLIMFDSEQYYVHSNMKDTLFFKKDDDSCMFGTVPYDDKGWHRMPLCTLQVYKDGHLLYTGKTHDHEYVESINLINNDLEFNL